MNMINELLEYMRDMNKFLTIDLTNFVYRVCLNLFEKCYRDKLYILAFLNCSLCFSLQKLINVFVVFCFLLLFVLVCSFVLDAEIVLNFYRSVLCKGRSTSSLKFFLTKISYCVRFIPLIFCFDLQLNSAAVQFFKKKLEKVVSS